MPTLTKQQLQSFSTQLAAREAELRGEVSAMRDEQDSPSQNPHDKVEESGERGAQLQREEVRHAEQARDVDELRDIAQARERLAAGTYGDCIDCGAAIPLARLKARPASARCMACQLAFEQQQHAR